MQLFPHPSSPPAVIEAVTASGKVRRGVTELVYRVTGDVLMAPAGDPARAADLWRHTCFELFVKPVGKPGYYEFNFAPSTAWAAYRFESYREGMADLEIPAPVIERREDGIRVAIDLGGLPEGEWRVGICAVIEEAQGAVSYWALGHPEGKADFHDAACFAVTVGG